MTQHDDDREAVEFVEKTEPKQLPGVGQSCSNCRFVRYEGSALNCGRHAPLGVLEEWHGARFATPVFPTVPCPPWCGDWEPG